VESRRSDISFWISSSKTTHHQARPMRTKPALLLLGALPFAPTLQLLHAQHPGRAMRPFGSDAELLQYLAVVDRARPSRQAQADRTCSDATSLTPGDKRIVITGRISDTAGSAIANAQVYAADRCTTAAADGPPTNGLAHMARADLLPPHAGSPWAVRRRSLRGPRRLNDAAAILLLP
jgi:hypothetical protein